MEALIALVRVARLRPRFRWRELFRIRRKGFHESVYTSFDASVTVRDPGTRHFLQVSRQVCLHQKSIPDLYPDNYKFLNIDFVFFPDSQKIDAFRNPETNDTNPKQFALV